MFRNRPTFGGVVWLPDNTFVFGTRQGLWRAPATGGQRELLTTIDAEKGEGSHVNPALLPDGETLVFGVFFDGPSRIETLSLVTGERTALVENSTKARYLEPGYLLYAETLPNSMTTGLVWAVPFDLDRLEVEGEPVLALTEVGTGNNEAQFTLAGDGTLISLPAGGQQRELVWVTREGREAPFADLLSTAPYPQSVDVSPDGTRLALEIGEGPGSQNESDVWTVRCQTN